MKIRGILYLTLAFVGCAIPAMADCYVNDRRFSEGWMTQGQTCINGAWQGRPTPMPRSNPSPESPFGTQIETDELDKPEEEEK